MMATPHMQVYRRNDTERRSEASLCNNGLLFLCVEAFAITKVSRLHAGADENWLVEQKDSAADLDFDNFGTSLTGSLVFCIHSSRLSLFCSNHLQGRHYFAADCGEPSRSHGYQFVLTHHIMTSSIHLGSFLCGLYFAEVGLSAQIAKICTQRKFPPYTVANCLLK